MANHTSAAKRNRQRITRTARNRSIKNSVRTKIKRVRVSLLANKLEDATKALGTAVSALDRAASKGALHPKAVSRTKARIARALHKAKSAPAS